MDNTFRADIEEQSYTGIDLGDQFTGALTLTNNDMSTATNDVITTGITIGSGTATITKSDLRSKSRQGVAIRLYGGSNHVLGTADIANRNTIENFQTGLETKYTANIISAIENKFTNTNNAVQNLTNNLLTITNSYFDAVDGPQDDSGYGTTGARVSSKGNNPDLVNYSPFYTDSEITTFDARLIIRDKFDASIGHTGTYD